jgi:hypothetical protein
MNIELTPLARPPIASGITIGSREQRMTPPIASQAPRAASAVPADRHRLLLEGGDARKPEPRKRRMAQRGSTYPLSSGRGGDGDWKNPITLPLSGWGEGRRVP